MFSTDYATAKDQIQATVKALHDEPVKPNATIRKEQVEQIIEAYYFATGKRPDDRILTRLSDYLLVDILADQYKHHRKDEFPIQSNNQVVKRQVRHNITTFDTRKDV